MKALSKYLEFPTKKACLWGRTRNEMTQEFEISEGRFSNILAKLWKSLGNHEFLTIIEYLRHL